MNFTINRAAFIRQLNNVLRAVSSKSTIPILTGLKLVVDNNEVVLTGSDADISIETTLSGADGQYQLTVEEPGAIVLPARFFIDIVKKLPDQQVTIAVTDGFQAQIMSGTAEFVINGQDANNYPHLPEIDTAASFEVAADLFADVIRQTQIAVSHQESRPILTGIHVSLADGILTAVATDSHRLSQRKVRLENVGERQVDVVIPGTSLTELSRMIGDVKDPVKIQVTDNQALFVFGNTRFYSRLLEGNYPDTSRLIPDTSETTVELDASAFLAAIERASLLSHQSRNNVVKLTVDPQAGLAKVSGNSADIGNVEENIATDRMEGSDLEISFNPDFMGDALKSFGQAKIILSFTTTLRPFTLVPTEDSDQFVQLITPVRTY